MASFAVAVAHLGMLLAVAVAALVTSLTTSAQLDSWGWRIPVGVGAALAFGIFLARRRMSETPAFEEMKASGGLSETPMSDLFRTARGPLAIAFILSTVAGTAYYLNVAYVPTFLATFEDVDSAVALRWSTIAAAVVLLITPLFGMAGDRFGRRPTLAVFAILLAVATPLLFTALDATSAAVSLLILLVLGLLAEGWVAASAAAIPEQLPGAIRVSGVAIGYNVATAVFGGFTPLVATWLVDTTSTSTMAIVVVSVVAVVGLVTLHWTPETARRPLR